MARCHRCSVIKYIILCDLVMGDTAVYNTWYTITLFVNIFIYNSLTNKFFETVFYN